MSFTRARTIARTVLFFSGGVTAARTAAADPPLEVQIVGEPGPARGARDPTGASTVIGAERLHAPGATAADVLAEVPGVQVARSGAASELSTASIRGATSAETPVYLAGVRLNDDVTGTADLSLVPLWMIQRVEVYRSGAPIEADRLGIGGAIFFEPILPRGARAGVGLGVGSFGEGSAWAAGAVGDARAGAMFAVRKQGAANDYTYLDDGGQRFTPSDEITRTRRNADYASMDAWAIGRVRAGRATLTAITSGLARDQGVTGPSLLPAMEARAHVQRWLGALTAHVPCARGEGEAGERCTLTLTSSVVTTTNEIRDPGHELRLGAPWLASRGARVAEEARLRYRIGDALTVGVGAAEEAEQLAIDSPSTALLRASRSTSRASAIAAAELGGRLSVNGLVTIERHATSGPAGSAGAIVEPSARAGARVRLFEGVELAANGGRYARVPTLGESYGISPLVQGNPDLVPEKGTSADAGARATRGPFTGEVFGFARFASDLIAFRQSSLGVIRPYNVASARVLGLELSANALVLGRLRLGLALTLLDPRDVSPDRTLTRDLLPYRSQVVAAPSLALAQGPIPAIGLTRASLGVRVVHRTLRFADSANLVPLSAQTRLDLDLVARFLGDRLTAHLEVDNALDAASFDTVGLPLPRRSLHGSMEVWLW